MTVRIDISIFLFENVINLIFSTIVGIYGTERVICHVCEGKNLILLSPESSSCHEKIEFIVVALVISFPSTENVAHFLSELVFTEIVANVVT